MIRVIIVALLSIPSFIHGQTYPKQEIDLSELADNLFPIQDLDLNYEARYENIVQQLSSPINLNNASSEELRFLNILSERQINSLLKYRRENGEFLSVYELQSVEGFDLNTIYKILPFITVPDRGSAIDKSLITRVLKGGNNYFISRYERTLQSKNGFSNEATNENKFRGSADKLYFRFRTSRPGDFSIGFTAKKDEGEQLSWRPSTNQYGFDYLSFHAQMQNKGRLKNLIIGDFQNQFGQGLILGGSFSLGKGGETITTTRKSNIGSTPYTSANESTYLRGISATYELIKNIHVTGFFSNTKRDGNISDVASDESSVSSLQTTGLHRNANELSARKTITETNFGTVLNYRANNFELGTIYNRITFSRPIERVPTLYNQYNFNGNQNENYGVFSNYSFYNASAFCEASKSIHGGMGIIAGVITSLSKNFDVSVVYRKYDRNYYSFYSNAFSESTAPQNESGTYLGWKYKPGKMSTSGYFDFFEFPWLRYRSYTPSRGYEWLCRLSYQPTKKVIMYIQAREEKKVRNVTTDPKLFTTSDGIKRNYLINFEYEVMPKIKMKTRAQFSTYELGPQRTQGMVLLQDVTADFNKFKISGRYAFFDTDDYDNRQYVYERNVWLAYSLPAYYGIGIRNFILVEYKVNKHIGLWVRYANTQYSNQNEIGSGVDKIIGRKKTDITFQLMLAL